MRGSDLESLNRHVILGTNFVSPPPRKHHFIPEFYLRWWTGADGRLERFTSPVDGKIVVRRVSPSEVGWEEDLYRAPHEDEKEAQHLEISFFQAIDSAAARALTVLNQGGISAVEPKHATAWSIFTHSLLLRTPAAFASIKAFGARQLDDSLARFKDRYQDVRKSTDPETFAEFVLRYDDCRREQEILRVYPDLVRSENMMRALGQLQWMMAEAPAGVPDLLLSDDPLARTNGLKTEGGHIAMPLSPRRLLIGAWDATAIRSLRPMRSRDLFRNMNRWTVEGARHFVASRDRAQDRFIRNRFGVNIKPPVLSIPDG